MAQPDGQCQWAVTSRPHDLASRGQLPIKSNAIRGTHNRGPVPLTARPEMPSFQRSQLSLWHCSWPDSLLLTGRPTPQSATCLPTWALRLWAGGSALPHAVWPRTSLLLPSAPGALTAQLCSVHKRAGRRPSL